MELGQTRSGKARKRWGHKMGERMYFGGGANESTMHPIVMIITLLAVILVLLLPRRKLFAPIMFACLLIPAGAQLNYGGFHLYSPRIIIASAVVRLLWVTIVRKEKILEGGLTALDRTFTIWALWRAFAFVALLKDPAAIPNQVAFLLDSYGGYLLFRYLLRDERDVLAALKTMVPIVGIIAVCMLYEHLTRVNVFNLIRTAEIEPWVRGTRVRAQGPFGQSITAGCLGATLLPLFVWLCKSRKTTAVGILGVGAAFLVTVSSVASTPLTACLCACLAMAFWYVRRYMRAVRWAVCSGIVVLALVMKAPVWYLLARVDFVGGHSWDRAFLVDQFAVHLGDWWLFGTTENASWGYSTWDTCNQFIHEAALGGVAALGLFVLLFYHGFSMIGRARKRVSGDSKAEWGGWCLGAGLFTHLVAFQGVAYFDTLQVWWLCFLAMIPAVTSSCTRRVDQKMSGTDLTSPADLEEYRPINEEEWSRPLPV